MGKPTIGTAVRIGRDKEGSIWKGFGNGTPVAKANGGSIEATRLTPAAKPGKGLHTVQLGG